MPQALAEPFDPILTRREIQPHDNDEARRQASEYLVRVGLFIPFDAHNLYHGRISPFGDDAFKVDPMFQDGGQNYNKIPALSAGTYSLAQEFADARLVRERRQNRPDIVRIVADDPHALIINGDFNMHRLTSSQSDRVAAAMRNFDIPLTSGSPLDFWDRDAFKDIRLKEITPRSGYIGRYAVSTIGTRHGIHPDVARNVLGSLNTRRILLDNPAAVTQSFLRERDTVVLEEHGEPWPINREYVASWFRSAHIVGVRKRVHSSTLDKDISPVFLFDLSSIHSLDSLEDQRQKRLNEYGSMAVRFGGVVAELSSSSNSLLKLLSSNLHATPRAIMKAAKRVGDFGTIFEADAGNKEGYTLEEHTETFLRVLDANYADKVPAGLLPILRLAGITHDIGKGIAASNNDKKHQQYYNAREAERFMKSVGVSEPLMKIILGMIGPAQKLTTQAAVRRDPGAYGELQRYCKKLLTDYNRSWATDRNADALAGMCMIIQTCDSVAYTDYAVTRSTLNGVHYRNYPAFNANLDQVSQFVRRRAKFRDFD